MTFSTLHCISKLANNARCRIRRKSSSLANTISSFIFHSFRISYYSNAIICISYESRKSKIIYKTTSLIIMKNDVRFVRRVQEDKNYSREACVAVLESQDSSSSSSSIVQIVEEQTDSFSEIDENHSRKSKCSRSFSVCLILSNFNDTFSGYVA